MYMSICTGRLEEAKDPLELEKQNVMRPCRDPCGILTCVARQWRKDRHRHRSRKNDGPHQLSLQPGSQHVCSPWNHRDGASWSLEAETRSQAITNWEHKAAAAGFYTHQHSNLNQGRRFASSETEAHGKRFCQLPTVLKLWSLSWLCPSK